MYALADRLHMRVADVMEMTEAEFRGWVVYLRILDERRKP